MSYSNRLRDRRWQRKRLEVMNNAKWICERCSNADDEIPLNVHHRRYIAGRMPWQYDPEDLLAVCDVCHKEIHGMRETDEQLRVVYQAMARAHACRDWNEMMKFADIAMEMIERGYYYRSLLDLVEEKS